MTVIGGQRVPQRLQRGSDAIRMVSRGAWERCHSRGGTDPFAGAMAGPAKWCAACGCRCCDGLVKREDAHKAGEGEGRK